jgi:hypothetical protein
MMLAPSPSRSTTAFVSAIREYAEMSAASAKPARDFAREIFFVDERDRMHERVEPSVIRAHALRERGERRIRGHVAGIRAAAEFGRELLDFALHAIALIRQVHERPVRVQFPRDPGRDAPPIGHARDERDLSIQQSHHRLRDDSESARPFSGRLQRNIPVLALRAVDAFVGQHFEGA